jgi:hypothetical protein
MWQAGGSHGIAGRSGHLHSSYMDYTILILLYVFTATGKCFLGLERGPLSLVSTTEELLNRKVAAPV